MNRRSDEFLTNVEISTEINENGNNQKQTIQPDMRYYIRNQHIRMILMACKGLGWAWFGPALAGLAGPGLGPWLAGLDLGRAGLA